MEKLEKRLGRFWRRVRRGRSATRDHGGEVEAQKRMAGKTRSAPDQMPFTRPPRLIDRSMDEGPPKSPSLATNHFIIHMRPKREGDADQSRLHSVVPKLVASELSPSTRRPPRSAFTSQPLTGQPRSESKRNKSKAIKGEFEELPKKKTVIIRRQSSKKSEFVTSSDGIAVKQEEIGERPSYRPPPPPSQVQPVQIQLPVVGNNSSDQKKEKSQKGQPKDGMSSSTGSSLASPTGKNWSEAEDTELQIRIPESPPLSTSLSLLSSSIRPSTVQSTRVPRIEFDDSSGYESGYLSHIDLNTPDLLFRPGTGNHSIETRKYRQRAANGRLRPYRAESHDEIHSRRSPAEEAATLLLLPRSTMVSHSDLYSMIDPNLRNRVDKTKFVTCTFEATNAGLDTILEEVVDELKRWIDGRALGVACEMHWTVPEKFRSRMHECRLKEAVHRVLRENNRAVLRVEDESFGGLKGTEERLAESDTRENQRRNHRNDTFEGVYQRCYSHLLPYCHRDTAHWHDPYWSWESLDRNVPLLLKAESKSPKNYTDERILRIRIVDLDDNRPVFLENDYLLFTADPNENSEGVIGRLQATDRDQPPNANFTYHLMPKCNPKLTDHLVLDPVTGVLKINGKIREHVDDLEEFCAIVSPFPNIVLDNLKFDPKNASMTKFRMKFGQTGHLEVKKLGNYRNNTILTIDPRLLNTRLPLVSPNYLPEGTRFELAQVDYQPALFVVSPENNMTTSLFSLDPDTGSLRVSPRISNYEQGIYSVSLNAIDSRTNGSIGEFVQKVHLVDDVEKLKFVFEMGPAEFAYNGEKLLHRLADALLTEDPEKEFDIVGDKIERYPGGEKQRSSICVHAAKAGRLLSRDALLEIIASALRKADSPLHNLYHIYKVINLEACTSKARHPQPLASSPPIAQSLLFLLCTICVVALFLFALCGYYCLVHRYRIYLDKEERKLYGNEISTLPPPIPPHMKGMPVY